MALLAHLLITFLSIFTLSQAHNILLRAHSQECFHESLHHDDRMTVTFQVGDREGMGSGNLEIDFWVCIFSNLVVREGSRLVFNGPGGGLALSK